MSDEWQTYGCQIDGQMAFVTYDHGVSTELDSLSFENLAVFSIEIADPDSRGMPAGEEANRLNALEDFLDELLQPDRALIVGRITCNGVRTLYSYTLLGSAECHEIAGAIELQSGRAVTLRHCPDLTRAGYWQELFPSDDDLQVIKDMRMHEMLMERGDPLTEPRPIRHWAYFKTADSRRAFLDDVAQHLRGLNDDAYETDDGQFAAMLEHVGLPDWQSMNAFTMKLNGLATKAGGEYDGWETELKGPQAHS
ncbi:hypothetical protein Pan44_52450 [Caulifigura coniformis]|uniref:Uncharacterized protein n=1 Tax=Caulifigura coniformis TaxID=2527983 RepID=A0A517SM40_9PLAN|nr:DUF695 domain-containing protein [Caulifigura coniformis]QDT57178.1 hypothetical protein Pan44_52450 [Caulifigura coniformis]